MASMNTRLNIEKLDGNIVQKHGGSKQGAQGDREAEIFQVSNDDTAVAQRRLEDKQLEEKINTDCLVKEQEKEYQTGVTAAEWAEDTTMSTYLVTRSPLSANGFKTPIDMLGFFGWFASIKHGMLEPVKVKCIFLGYRKRNMGFNESGEYKKTFIGYGVGTGSMQVLQGDEFEVEPQDGHTFEVEPHRNVDHVVGSHKVQTQDLIHYHPARDREQHLACELFRYREDSNEAAFAVAAVEKIYAHESLTFNDTVAGEVISKWKAGLKDDMDARSDMYVLSNDGKKCSDESDVYYWEYTPGDCDVEKNGKWSCIYAVGSQEYQMVCTRLDIASADVGMLDKFDRGLQTDIQVFVDFYYAMAAYMTLTGSWKKKIWLKGLMAESRYELNLVAGIATGALVKDGSRSEVPTQVEGAAYRF
ncbi:hypothetical protein Tco_0963683 [Tanacetum coccineum]